MIDPSIIKTEIDNLETLAVDIEKNIKKLFNESEIGSRPTISDRYGDYVFLQISGELWDLQREIMKNYENWYSMSLIYIMTYVPEKKENFVSCYFSKNDNLGIVDLIKLHSKKKIQVSLGDNAIHKQFKDAVFRDFVIKFDQQRNTLLTISGIVKIKELSIRGIIYTTFIDREIDEAVYLFDKGHFRAAGAIAGVALEQHLRFLCDKYSLEYGNKDTIEPLLHKLYKNDKIDLTEMKQIQHLASIRDKCDHPSEISASEVKELIEKIKRILNN